MEKNNPIPSKDQTEEQKAKAVEAADLAEKMKAEEKALAEKMKAEEKALAGKVKAAQTRTEHAETKDGKSKPTEEQSELLPAEKERHLFHVELDTPAFDPKTGKKLTKPRMQIFSENEWKTFEANAKQLGYETKVLWNPTKYK